MQAFMTWAQLGIRWIFKKIFLFKKYFFLMTMNNQEILCTYVRNISYWSRTYAIK